MHYVIPTLTIKQLNALQNAIVAGAFNRQIKSLQLAIESNRGHTSIQDQFLEELTALQEAGRAIMNACPTTQSPEHATYHAARNLAATHRALGYNSEPFQQAYAYMVKGAGYDWEVLAKDLPPVSAERGRSLS
jgi:hypothetical protein